MAYCCVLMVYCCVLMVYCCVVLRNSLGSDRLFTHKSHPVFESLSALCENVDSNNIHSVKAMPLNADLTQGMSGDVLPEDSPDNTLPGKYV